MPNTKRISILTVSEITELFGPPTLNLNDQRFFFALNDAELAECKGIRDRKQRCMFVLLLGYFKVKPVILSCGFHQIKQDLKYICSEVLPGSGFRPFNLKQKAQARVYQRIFKLTCHQRWQDKIHRPMLEKILKNSAHSWVQPRFLFDTAIEYLSTYKIAIPGYTILQDLISNIISKSNNQLISKLNQAIPADLTSMLFGLIDGDDALSLRKLRRAAKSFSNTELEKELVVYHYLNPWMSEIRVVLQSLSLSQKNQAHYAERVDYYGAKLKRQSSGNQQLYLLCYLQDRVQQALERIADGFIHHVRQVKQKAKSYAQEETYNDWQKAAKNVGKAAEVLHLFIDDNIEQTQPFENVKQHALTLLDTKELESVCLFLNKQKRSVNEAMWQYYDQRESLRTGLLRKLFECLHFEGSDGNQLLADALNQARLNILGRKDISPTIHNVRILPQNQLIFLQNEGGLIKSNRYEWYLYLQIPNRLNGQLTLPDVIKYRALDADLVGHQLWKKEKAQLLQQTQQPKLTAEPKQLITRMATDLSNRLHEVSDYLEQTDNRNIIMRNPKGKRLWRFPSANKKDLVNNPFFQQMPTTGVADMLRMVDRDTAFIDCFEHVLGVQPKSRIHEYDLLAILVGNATNQGIYGISQISDRTYDQLSTIQANYLRLETLGAANDFITNATAKLPIFKYYNIQKDIIHASADGQKFETRRETFKTRYSSKYFGTQKGLSAMSLIANHAAINTRVIGANEHESHFIFDLLMSNSSEISPDVLSTDTHGVNHVNFALLDLFGYQFAPRYAKVGKVINDLFDVTESKDGKVHLQLKKPINTKRITQHWDTIQRIAISLNQRKTTQATLVRKLSGYKKNHPLLEALTEYNRLVKANYLLSYIDDSSLRNFVQRALNRGEAYHQLRRAVSHVNGDRFRGSSDDEILLWNECARLVTNAIIYFNSSVLSRLHNSFEHQNDEKKIEIVRQASPVAWYNINLKGTYNFELSEKLPTLEEMMRTIEGYLPVE